VKDQSTPSYRAIPGWLVSLPKVDTPSITSAETDGPLSQGQIQRYWRMRRAYWWMSETEILRRLRDPEMSRLIVASFLHNARAVPCQCAAALDGSVESVARNPVHLLHDNHFAAVLTRQHGSDHDRALDYHLQVLIDSQEIQSIVQ